MAGCDAMTDARFPERWLNDRRVLRLSDAGFRLFVTSLAWSASNRTDGVLFDDDLALIPRTERGCDAELAKAGLWDREKDRWLIVDFVSTQTTRSELDRLDNVRRAEREKKARRRARDRSEGDSPPVTSPVTVPVDDTGEARPRPGRLGEEETEDQTDNKSTDWAEVRRPPGDLSDEGWQQLAAGYEH